MRAIDTNVLVRLIVQDDEKQVADAKAFIELGAWVSKIVLAEAVWVIGSIYRHAHSDIADAIEMLLSNSQIFLEDAEAVTAALAHYRKHPSLRFSDCLILEGARKAGYLPLGTFDRGLSKLDGAARL